MNLNTCPLTRQQHAKSNTQLQPINRNILWPNHLKMPSTSSKNSQRFSYFFKIKTTSMTFRQSKSRSVFAIIRTINALKCLTQSNPVTILPKNYALKSTIYQLRYPVLLQSVKKFSLYSKKNKLTFVPHSCKAWVADILWRDIISNFDLSWTWFRGILTRRDRPSDTHWDGFNSFLLPLRKIQSS